MPNLSFPVQFVAEFRGMEPGKTWVDSDTGEHKASGALLKLERELLDGDVMPIPVRLQTEGSDFGAYIADGLDPSKLKRGDKVTVEGEVVLKDRYPGYFRAHRVGPGTASLKAAS